MRTKWLVMGFVFVAWGMTAEAAVSPDDVLQAIDQMTVEQIHQLHQKLEAKIWEPVPEGFFTRLSADFGGSYSRLDKVDLSSVSLSGGDLDVKDAGGANFGLLWRVGAGDRFRLGTRFGSWHVRDSNRADEGYSRADVYGGLVSLAVNYQIMRSDSWILWTEVAPGGGWIGVDTLDTPAGAASTLRSFDRSFTHVDLQAGGSWRLNSAISFYLSGGYRWSEAVNLKEGGGSTDVRVDASGFGGRLGLAVNF